MNLRDPNLFIAVAAATGDLAIDFIATTGQRTMVALTGWWTDDAGADIAQMIFMDGPVVSDTTGTFVTSKSSGKRYRLFVAEAPDDEWKRIQAARRHADIERETYLRAIRNLAESEPDFKDDILAWADIYASRPVIDPVAQQIDREIGQRTVLAADVDDGRRLVDVLVADEFGCAATELHPRVSGLSQTIDSISGLDARWEAMHNLSGYDLGLVNQRKLTAKGALRDIASALYRDLARQPRARV